MLSGKKINGHLIQSMVGQGAMGVVYKAVHEKLNEVVAIKFLRNLSQITRFAKEGKIGERVNHPHVVQIFDMGELKDFSEYSHYIIMEFVNGHSLREIIAQNKLLSRIKIINIFLEISAGLEAMHNAGIVHRDLKPENILITDSGMVKITDFGVIKLNAETQLTKTGSLLGTPAYMSPEQCKDSSRVDIRTDIYSLGVMLFEMLAGELPFKGPSHFNFILQHSTQKPPALKNIVANLPHRLYQMIDKMLAKEREKRYLTVTQVKMQLKKVSMEMLEIPFFPPKQKIPPPARKIRSKTKTLAVSKPILRRKNPAQSNPHQTKQTIAISPRKIQKTREQQTTRTLPIKTKPATKKITNKHKKITKQKIKATNPRPAKKTPKIKKFGNDPFSGRH